MKIFFLSLALVLCCSVTALSQKPTPVPQTDDEIVKISTSLIQIDVTVTDTKGNPVKDLKPEDFEIYENGKRQDISNFSFVSNIKTETETPAKKDEKAALLLPPSAVKPGQVRRTIALVVDDLTLSFSSTYWVRQALKKFVDEQMQPGDLVAIIRTGAGIGALQQFTTDKRQLYSAIEKVRWNMSPSAKISVFNPLDSDLKEQTGGGGEADKNLEREVNDFRESIFASGTLGALNFIIRGMRDLPGRKSVMLLSDGLRLYTRDDRGFPQSSRILDSLRRLTDLANRASVVVYTIDPKGLSIPGLTAADNTWGLSSEQIERRLSDRREDTFDSQDGLMYLAQQTGGFPVLNTNNVGEGIRRVLDDQSYYLIGYQPDDETFDPKTRRYNKLEIKVKNKDLRVRYRSGFFGISDDQMDKPKLSVMQSILNALTSPFAVNDISLRLSALFASDPKQGSYVRSYLHVNANDLKFTREADGNYKTVFDLVALSFGDNGSVVDELSRTYTVTLKEDAYRKMLERGFVYQFILPVKKSGGYQMRVALRDRATDKVGSANQFIEVPNIKKNRLTLSGIVLENMPLEQWQKFSDGTTSYEEIKKSTDPLTDTALRQFKNGTILRFGFEIYNAKLDSAQKPNLTTQVRIFRDGKIYLEGKEIPLEITGQDTLRAIDSTGSIRLGSDIAPGDYVLQVIVTDGLASKKRQIATQFMAFEIVE